MSGLLKTADLTSAPGLLAAGTAVFGLMQLVFQLFKDHATFGPLLTDAPALPAASKPAVP